MNLNGVMALILLYFTEFGSLRGALRKRSGWRCHRKKVYVSYLVDWSVSCSTLRYLAGLWSVPTVHRAYATLWYVSCFTTQRRRIFRVFLVNSYGTQSDMWVIGCILYELCAHDRPFKGSTLSELIMNILHGKYAPLSKYARVFICN